MELISVTWRYLHCSQVPAALTTSHPLAQLPFVRRIISSWSTVPRLYSSVTPGLTNQWGLWSQPRAYHKNCWWQMRRTLPDVPEEHANKENTDEQPTKTPNLCRLLLQAFAKKFPCQEHTCTLHHCSLRWTSTAIQYRSILTAYTVEQCISAMLMLQFTS